VVLRSHRNKPPSRKRERGEIRCRRSSKTHGKGRGKKKKVKEARVKKKRLHRTVVMEETEEVGEVKKNPNKESET